MEKNKKQILFLGDIHGNFEYVKWYIKAHKIKDCVIYQVGDFGIGFTEKANDMNVLGNLNKFLTEHNIKMYAIRGNHDNPAFFDGHLANHFTNLHLLQDYTVIDVEGTKILGVGGAVSVDRVPRLRQMREAAKYGRDIELHWDDEVFILDEEKLKTFENIDIVVTHTAPDFCAPDNKNGFGYLVGQFAQDDPKLYDDLREERTLLTKMCKILEEKNKPDLWLYGHYHRNWTGNVEGVNYRLLDINEFYPYRNWKDYEPDWENNLKEKGTE
jgi:Icc-related predicted phosphoesterase